MRVFQCAPSRAKQFAPSRVARRERGEVGRERGDCLGGLELDVDVARPEVVALDRVARSRSTPSAAKIGSGSATSSQFGQRLLHPAEDDPRAVALELDRDDTGAGLEPDDDLRERPAEHERRAERRMAGERQLVRRREDADAGRRRPARSAAGRTRSRARFISRAIACISSVLRSRRVREDGELVARRAGRR